MILDDGYIACICEGSAEQAIMDLLLEHDKLIFTRSSLIDDEIIRCRKAKNFETKYLKKGFNKTITVVRILDSRKEEFKLSRAYKNKVKVINIITAPEIEMLIIINENKREKFNKSNKKPSEFCKCELKYGSVKNYDFVYNYFSDIDKLINSIEEYKRISKIKKDEKTLFDIIK